MAGLQQTLLVSSIGNDNDDESSSMVERILGDDDESNNKVIKSEIIHSSSNVVIHVCDESRNLEKSFECDRQLLIDRMAYFKKYLSNDTDNFDDQDEEIDISVHCDIFVFEWLIQYICAEDTRPKLEIHNVVSILISSHFLQMTELVNQCVEFMCKYLNEIIQLPLDLSCLNDEIINMLARNLNILQIDLLNDSTDKIASRLYRFHLETLMKQKENKLFYCIYCGELYTIKQRKKLICYKSPIYINFHGDIIRKHCAQKRWYICKYLLGLRLQNYSWRAIYCHLWALTREPLYCYKCNQYITIPKLYHCMFHTKQEKIKQSQSNTIFYGCCQYTQDNFQIVETERRGCANKRHQILIDKSEENQDNEEIDRILNTVTKHAQYILVPSDSISTANKWFSDRAQSAEHRSRLNKHHPSHDSIKKITVTTGVWDKKYFLFGSQSSSKALNTSHQNPNNNVLRFDIYHKPSTFWYDDGDDNSFEYLSHSLTFDNIDYGEGDDDDYRNYIEGEDDDYDDDDDGDDNDGSDLNMEHVKDMIVSQQFDDNNKAETSHSPQISPITRKSKKKGKSLPIRERRIKAIPTKNRFCVDFKANKAFHIEQNDIRRLDALIKSLSENRQS